ncbi:MAG: AraC family transcriptional regulator [Clostridiales bacterium]|nr:AraC family transcriptional regulator [Clostridiales bacterium]
MDWMNRLNNVMSYVEKHLTGTIDPVDISLIMACSFQEFQRFFIQISDIPFSEYVRRRKLSSAAYEIQNSDIKIIDAALKYGYESADAFSVAFKRLHGLSPQAARKTSAALKYYARLNFSYTIKGVNELTYRIVQRGSFTVAGIRTTSSQAQDLFHVLQNDGTARRLELLERRFDLGICFLYHKDGDTDYMIALEYDGDELPDFERYSFPPSAWLVVEASGKISENIHADTWRRLYNEFMPHSEYMQTDLPAIEKYVEWNAAANYGQLEIWLPIKQDHEFDHQFIAV